MAHLDLANSVSNATVVQNGKHEAIQPNVKVESKSNSQERGNPTATTLTKSRAEPANPKRYSSSECTDVITPKDSVKSATVSTFAIG